MITPANVATLHSSDKAQLIYKQVQSEMASQLWRAALGGEEAKSASAVSAADKPMSLSLLLALLDGDEAPSTVQERPAFVPASEGPKAVDPEEGRRRNSKDKMARSLEAASDVGVSDVRGYGPNAGYAGYLSAAGRRTGMPPAALATIVHAEAAKDRDGRWLPYSRNPRSSAAGLGQFLSSTWCGEAARKGTWLNMVAEEQGWLGKNGKVKGAHRGDLLALRYNPEAAIQVTADYAAANLDGLRKAGATIGDDAQSIAQAAYLGHHLGKGDAVRFIKGGLAPERAHILLNAQVGAAAASRRIADSGNAASAHKSWLMDYISKNIRVDRFTA